MTEFEFLLADRIQKIKSMNELYDLDNNSYISYSGGKDSTVLSALVDLALPNNKIPRVYINTGIEYKMIVSFVEREREKDSRIQIIFPKQNIAQMLEEYGFPFKSKEHSNKVSIFQHTQEQTKTVKKYLNTENKFGCPQKLLFQFKKDYSLKISDKCCYKLKKEPSKKWAKENGKTICMTGMRNAEGGQRANKSCSVFTEGHLEKFHPLMIVEDSFIEEFINQYKIKLCDLYYPPFNFERTGCKGCPYSLNLQEQLETMSLYLPAEKKQCELIWKPVYSEYRRIQYRLNDSQPLLF